MPNTWQMHSERAAVLGRKTKDSQNGTINRTNRCSRGIGCSTGFGAKIHTCLWCSNYCSKLGYYDVWNGFGCETRRCSGLSVHCIDACWTSTIGGWPWWPWLAVWTFCWFYHRLSARSICDRLGHGTCANECSNIVLYRLIHGGCGRPLYPRRHWNGLDFGQVVNGCI